MKRLVFEILIITAFNCKNENNNRTKNSKSKLDEEVKDEFY